MHTNYERTHALYVANAFRLALQQTWFSNNISVIACDSSSCESPLNMHTMVVQRFSRTFLSKNVSFQKGVLKVRPGFCSNLHTSSANCDSSGKQPVTKIEEISKLFNISSYKELHKFSLEKVINLLLLSLES